MKSNLKQFQHTGVVKVMDVDTGSVEALWVTKPTNTSTQKGQAEENRSKKNHALSHGIKKGAGIIKKVQWESICFRRRRHAKHFYSCRIRVGDWATLPAHTEREGDCWIGQGSERSLSVTASLQRAQNHSNTVEQSKHTPPIFNFFH